MTALLFFLAQAAFAQTVFVPLEAAPIPRLVSCERVPDAVLPPAPEFLPGLAAVPETPLQSRTALLKVLTDGIVWDGAQRRSRNEAARVLRAMMGRMEPQRVRRLVDQNAKLVLIPRDGRLTDLPAGRKLKGKKVEDGRRFEILRGLADGKRVDGFYHVFVGEENLLEKRFIKGYPPRSLLVHEWGHAIHSWALTLEENRELQRVLRAAKRRQVKFPDKYSTANYFEFFAEMTVVWFGLWRSSGNRHRVGPDWIKENLPELYDAFSRLYGPVRTIRPR